MTSYSSYAGHNGEGNHEEWIPLKGASNGGRNREERKRKRSRKDTCVVVTTIAASILALLLCARVLLAASWKDVSDLTDDGVTNGKKLAKPKDRSTKDLFDENGRFVLEDYDSKPSFSDFLPGVAGIYGKPVWAFYVNRGQGIASFGTKSKDFPIMEFNSANKAYQNTALLGFRTFLQGSRPGKPFFTEPFTPVTTHYEGVGRDDSLPKRHMFVGANEMQIQETDIVNRIETNVSYFTLPEEDFGAFVRRTTITNLDPDLPVSLSILDGLARMEPSGGKLQKRLKTISRTLEGWMGVYQPYKDGVSMPFYRLSTEPSDTASVKIEEAGHYCLSLVEGNPSQLLPIIYDTNLVFGEDTMMLRPIGLESKSVGELIAETQYGFAKTPSAFAAVDQVTLEPGESITMTSFYGKAAQIMDVPVIARRISQPGFVLYKYTRAREIIKQITAGVETNTANHLFNGHVQQVFLDNSLRGGIPVILGEEDDDAKYRNADEDRRLKVYHLFSRIHGDLERDYNDFEIDPTFFSQGPGNYRDVVQNRRSDVIFNPRIGSFNVKMFLSYIQADAYEPLSVEAVVFTISDKNICDRLAEKAVGYAEGHRAQREALSKILNSGPFRPGQLFLLLEKQNIEIMMPPSAFIDLVSAAAECSPMAVFKEGYWADHWTYYLDLIESYVTIFPDREEALMYDEELPYFFSPGSVRPRSQKYVLSVSFDGKGKHVRQLEATLQEDKKKMEKQMDYVDNTTGWFDVDANWQRDAKGEIFKSSPIAKLFLLATVKFATRDAYGMGVEYEGGKPGWNDAMNGLVGMVGSGMPETFELEMLLHYILTTVSKYQRPVVVPIEIANLIDAINSALDSLMDYDYVVEPTASVPDELFQYWDTVASAREQYRSDVKLQFSGETTAFTPRDVESILRRWLSEINLGKARAISIGTHGINDDGTSGITPTYFSYNVTKWKLTGKRNKEGHDFAIPKEMAVSRFPLFLEGPVRMMKSVDSVEARDIYGKVKKSGLRDEGLGMYTISASLEGQSYDMGRMMAFAPGWLENQSVWLHMSYKFYLELIRKNLFHEFYSEMTSGGLLPFMDPKVYGRSLMECSSFIASSAFMDPSIHGRGFLARLSGSTAEFLSMWVLMMIGPDPFYIDAKTGELRMQLVPALPLWLFESDGGKRKTREPLTVTFKLFAEITVTYHNQRGEDLFRIPPKRYHIGLRDGSTIDIDGPTIPSDLADKIRRVVFVDSIDAYFE